MQTVFASQISHSKRDLAFRFNKSTLKLHRIIQNDIEVSKIKIHHLRSPQARSSDTLACRIRQFSS